MKKFLISIIGAFVVFSAGAVGENIPTTKAYVDSTLTQKQDIIEHTTGANQVLTNTGTAGEYGTKEIYNSTNAYGTQMDELVDAQTMNAAVQNAIDSEFQCIEWANPNDHTSPCLLMEIQGTPPQSVLPAGYTALEYLESNGTQYINSDIGPTNNVGVSIKYSIIQKNAYTGIFGTYQPYYYLGITSASDGANMSVSYGSGGGSVVLSIPNTDIQLGKIYDLDINLFNSGKVAFVGISNANLPSRTFTSNGRKISLFGLMTGSDRANNLSSARIYNMKITDGNNLVRNFIPAQRNNDGVIGMYDTVNNTFYTNAGTGEFIAGPIVYLPAGN